MPELWEPRPGDRSRHGDDRVSELQPARSSVTTGC